MSRSLEEVSAASQTLFSLMLPLLKILCCYSLLRVPLVYSAYFTLHSLQVKQGKKISFHTCTRLLAYDDIPYLNWPPYSADFDTNDFGRVPQIKSAFKGEDFYPAHSIQ